jgi:addiction module RelE/StbE family toxin
VRRLLLRSSAFVRSIKRAIKKDPRAADQIQAILEILSDDAFHPQLRTHKLTGVLEGHCACSVGYDLRIVFRFMQHEGMEAILLETLGSHEEVY